MSCFFIQNAGQAHLGVSPYNAEIFLYKLWRPKGPLYIFTLSVRWSTLESKV